MKGRIPDPANPSPLVLAIREKIAKAKAEGNALVLKARQLSHSEGTMALVRWAADQMEFAEIERQLG